MADPAPSAIVALAGASVIITFATLTVSPPKSELDSTLETFGSSIRSLQSQFTKVQTALKLEQAAGAVLRAENAELRAQNEALLELLEPAELAVSKRSPDAAEQSPASSPISDPRRANVASAIATLKNIDRRFKENVGLLREVHTFVLSLPYEYCRDEDLSRALCVPSRWIPTLQRMVANRPR